MRVTITASEEETRILVHDARGERLLGHLPSVRQTAHLRALPCLLEALALWWGSKVSVVLCVDERFGWVQSGLSDIFESGLDTLFFDVEVVPLEPALPRRAKRVAGMDSTAGVRVPRRRDG